MREPDALLTLGAACVTPYSVLMALGALLACLLTLALCRKSIGTERGVSLCACTVAGAVLGGLLIGFIEIVIVALFPALSGYRDAFAFIVLIVVLLVKPTGLLGEKTTEKV